MLVSQQSSFIVDAELGGGSNLRKEDGFGDDAVQLYQQTFASAASDCALEAAAKEQARLQRTQRLRSKLERQREMHLRRAKVEEERDRATRAAAAAKQAALDAKAHAKADAVARQNTVPELPAGAIEVDVTSKQWTWEGDRSGSKKKAAAVLDALPQPVDLRRWTRDCQHAFWMKRQAFWRGQPMKKLQAACNFRGIWAGGDALLLRDRLVRWEFDPALLQLDDIAPPADNTTSTPSTTSPASMVVPPCEPSDSDKRDSEHVSTSSCSASPPIESPVAPTTAEPGGFLRRFDVLAPSTAPPSPPHCVGKQSEPLCARAAALWTADTDYSQWVAKTKTLWRQKRTERASAPTSASGQDTIPSAAGNAENCAGSGKGSFALASYSEYTRWVNHTKLLWQFQRGDKTEAYARRDWQEGRRGSAAADAQVAATMGCILRAVEAAGNEYAKTQRKQARMAAKQARLNRTPRPLRTIQYPKVQVYVLMGTVRVPRAKKAVFSCPFFCNMRAAESDRLAPTRTFTLTSEAPRCGTTWWKAKNGSTACHQLLLIFGLSKTGHDHPRNLQFSSRTWRQQA
eukprot:SAG31_NODE_6138_length_2153_cov_1.119279_2_plen_570_part_01